MAAGPAPRRPRAPAAAAPVAAPNKYRGEAAITLGDKTFALCLTMNALVEIEETMGVPLARLGEVLAQPSLKQVRSILGSLIRGGGAKSPTRKLPADDEQDERPAPLSDEEVGAYPFALDKAVAAIEAAFAAAGVFSKGEEGEGGDSGNAPRPT